MAKQEKLKNYEITALANSVYEKVKAAKYEKVKTVYQKDIASYLESYNRIQEQIVKLTKEHEVLREKYAKKLKLSTWGQPSEHSILAALAEYPSQYDIEREIILKGIFSDKSELEEFIKELVKKFS